MFNEKDKEYSAKQGKELPVWQTDKYKESRQKSIDIIENGKYGVSYSDFWILMNETKSGKMAYSGLIVSHNGCLKINDALPADKQFDPDCVSVNENGFNGSLVFYYCNKAQGLFETGEVSAKNCKNDYPYAMAEKRLFDRVVLKNSKLAYAGIYGEDEADEFKHTDIEPETKAPQKAVQKPTEPFNGEPPTNTIYVCERCKQPIISVTGKDGSILDPKTIVEFSQKHHGKNLCADCQMELRDGK